MDIVTEFVDINRIRIGDTVIHNGKETTITGKDIKSDVFMGRTLFGDSYRLGYKKVERFKYIGFFK